MPSMVHGEGADENVQFRFKDLIVGDGAQPGGQRGEPRRVVRPPPAGVATGVNQTGVATGVNTIARTVGGAVGAQIAVALLHAAGPAGPGQLAGFPAQSGYTSAFIAFAVVAAGAAAAVATIPVRGRTVSAAGRPTRPRVPTD
ncbi:hypothetical protein [Streptomyces sp. NPDC005336]|uniref:hypothetical protein n=1 Tax=Streptomyces sp. NPDC005336 TaxID=3157035 RepID=UPI0033A90075